MRFFFESSNDYRHGLEHKSGIRRSQQSRLYLEKALETLKAVEVRSTARIVRDGVLS
jgi:hypothetical protein